MELIGSLRQIASQDAADVETGIGARPAAGENDNRDQLERRTYRSHEEEVAEAASSGLHAVGVQQVLTVEPARCQTAVGSREAAGTAGGPRRGIFAVRVFPDRDRTGQNSEPMLV